MFKNLSPRALGFAGTVQSELIELALTYGFKSIDLDIVDFAEQVAEFGLDHSKRLIESAEKSVPEFTIGNFNLPIDVNTDEVIFKRDLERLPTMAKLAQDLGCKRALFSVQPAGDKLAYPENFELHKARLAEVGKVLAGFGVALAISFSAPQTLRKGKKFEFIHDLDATITLVDMIKLDNVGLLVDFWEIFANGGTLEDVKKIDVNKIVSVHLADLPEGFDAETLFETDRLFPGETNVIDPVAALKLLEEKGYEGPVTPKTLRNRVKGMGREQAIRNAGEYLQKAWKAVHADETVDAETPETAEAVETVESDASVGAST